MTRSVTFAGWGGHNQEAQARHWLEPFTRETGIEVRQETLQGYDELKRQVEAGETRWDVMVSGNNFGLRRDAPWLEALPDRIWRRPDLLPGMASPLRVPDLVYSIVIHWRADRVPRPVEGWRDFFDPDAIPGPRVTYDIAQYGLLEAALLGDGVAPANLYPLDLDRAFRSLDRIRDELVMTRDLDAADELLATGDAVMALYSQNHAYLARHKSDRTQIQWRQQILLGEYLVIPRGAPHRPEAEALIDYIVSPEPQSRLSQDLTYSPINIHAVPDATMAPHMTFTHRSPDDAAFDDEWWADHVDEVTQRLIGWKAARRSPA
jgi:putative spermidine/putrescine transport system substrate-binding protein